MNRIVDKTSNRCRGSRWRSQSSCLRFLKLAASLGGKPLRTSLAAEPFSIGIIEV